MDLKVLPLESLLSLKTSLLGEIESKCDHSSGRRKYVEDESGDGDYVYCDDCGKYLSFNKYPML